LSWIGSIEPVWIIVLSPLFAIMWTRLGNRAPTTPRKFAYGVIGMGARISCSICGSMLPPDRIITVRPGGVDPCR
jgi:dipeptide/tripeptide permease